MPGILPESFHLHVAPCVISSSCFTDERTEAWGGETTCQAPLTSVTNARHEASSKAQALPNVLTLEVWNTDVRG